MFAKRLVGRARGNVYWFVSNSAREQSVPCDGAASEQEARADGEVAAG